MYLANYNKFLIFNRIDALPKNLNTIAKELFRMGVCLKPRLIRSGIERLKSSSNPQEIVSEVDILGNITYYIFIISIHVKKSRI